MKQYKNTTALLLVSVSMAATAEVKWIEQPTPQPTDVAIAKSSLVNSNKERVAYNMNLIGQTRQVYQNQGYVAESKQYWVDTNRQQLTQGVSLPITSGTAIIRVNPLNTNSKSQAISQSQVELTMAGKQLQPSTFADGQQLKAAGMPVAESVIAMKVEAQAGELQLKVNGIAADNSPYVVHVFEPESEHVLALKTLQQNHASGAEVVVKAGLSDAAGMVPMQVNGYLTAPNGEKLHNLTFNQAQDGDYQAVLSGLSGRSMGQGLWEVHTITETTVNGVKVLRDASTAFAMNLASAQFNQQLKLENGQLSLGIENGTAGRYEIRGTLLGHDEQGSQKPIALMMTAQWLAAGDQSLAFDWPTDLIKMSGLQAPFVVAEIELKNQSLMAPVQRVEAGVMITQLTESMDDLK